MTRKYIEEQMEEIRRITQLPFETFYLRYTSNNGHIITNRWGGMKDFERILKESESSSDCVGESLPIKLLVLTNSRTVHCWTKNPFWNGVDYPEEDSHVYTNVPLVGRRWFVDPKDWLDIDSRNPELSGSSKKSDSDFDR